MPTYNTHELIQQLQQQTENTLHEAISEWQLLPAAALLRQPSANHWSAAQCLEHLNSYGRYYLPAIAKAIETSKANGQTKRTEFTSGWLGNYFTNMMKPSSKMKKMSAPKDHTPVANLDVPNVIAEFIDQQERLLVLLEKAAHIDMNRTTVPISIAKFIRLKLGDVFMFLIAHTQRHIVQAERTLEANHESSKVL
jgi:hypothetical protein